MKIRFSGKTEQVFDATVSYEHGLLLGCINIPSDQVEGLGVELEVVEANAAELAVLQGAGYGDTLAGVREMLETSAARRRPI